jgi:hypothetical protein
LSDRIASLDEAVRQVKDRIEQACRRSGRDPEDVRLIAITKTVPGERVAEAAEAGLSEFGENYVQEMEMKREAAPDATWHFVGKVQRNKAHRILAAADLVQTLEPGRGAERLVRLASARGTADCLVEVDSRGDRVGVAPEEAEGFVAWLAGFQAVRVRGLMTVAPPGTSARPCFARLRELRDQLRTRFPEVRELSMGMSEDYEEAVEEGATMIRLGTAIFGPRA